MNIRVKIIAGYLPVLFFMICIAFYAISSGKKYLVDAAGHHSVFIAEQMMKQILKELTSRVDYMESHIKDLGMIHLLHQSNEHFSRYDAPDRVIDKIDSAWKKSLGQLTSAQKALINSRASFELREKFITFHQKTYGILFFRNVFITNQYGVNVCQTEFTSDYNQSDEIWWQRARKDRLYIKESHLDESGEIHGIVVAIRVDDRQNQFIGVIKALIPTISVTRMAEANIRLYESTETILINQSGKLLYASKPTKLYQNVSDRSYFNKMTEESGFFLDKSGSITKLISYIASNPISHFQKLNWILVLKHEEKEVLAKSLLLTKQIMIATTGALLLAFMVIFFITEKITRPIGELNNASKEVAKGRFDKKVTYAAPDEIGELSMVFNRMTKNLKRSYERLNYEIKARKQAQKELSQINEELKRSNTELEQFAYVASHDLQEPLRKVKSYMDLVMERYHDQLDDDGKAFIRYAVDGATRMKTMINDLLEYSRAGRKDRAFVTVDMKGVVEDVLKDLALLISENQANITMGSLPSIKGDKVQIAQLFFNLIGNAIKYRGKAPPEITISATEKTSAILFSVKDNGIGIDPAFHHIIFQIFQRLYSKSYRKGSGIGLAIAKKIVEAHGGEIGIHSTPGEGSTLFFSIPKP